MRPGAERAATESSPGLGAVTVDDDQDAWPVDADRWRDLAVSVLAELGVPSEAEVSLSFVTADAMADLNLAHMDQAGPTDVLSFPIDGGAPVSGDGPPPMLGDIVICPEVAAANAPEHAGTYDDEIALLVVHGLLHLLGIDHAADDERDAMQARERDLLERFYGPLARDAWTA
jgi:probable rRNA maturation factor